MSRSNASLRLVKLVGIGAVLMALAAGLALVSRPPVPASGGFWESFRISGLEVRRYDTLDAMLQASDAVVVAKVSDVQISRTVQGDSPDDIVTYARVDLRVEGVLFGDVPGDVPLEFLLGPTPEHAAADLLGLRQWIPTGPSVYFLHEKQGQGERGLYRVTSTAGLWSATARDELDAPLQETSPKDSGLYAAELGGVDTLQGLTELLAGYAARQ